MIFVYLKIDMLGFHKFYLLFFFLVFFFLIVFDILQLCDILNINEDKEPKISIGAKVEIGKEAATEISKGIGSLGSNIGLAGSIGSVTAGVAKVISKSSLPPIQKTGVVLAGATIGGAIHTGASALNRLNSNISNTPSTYSGVSSTTPSSTTPSLSTSSTISSSNLSASDSNLNIKKLLGDNNNYNFDNDLINLILSINIISYACLSLIIILFFIILFKFYLNEDKIKLNISSYVGDKFNDSLNYYLIKLIKLNKKTSSIYIFIIIFLLFIGLGFNCYFITELYNNFNKYLEIYINSR